MTWKIFIGRRRRSGRLAPARHPIRFRVAEDDGGKARVLHHPRDLLAREALLEARPETVEGIGAHRVEAALAVPAERIGGHVAAAPLGGAGEAGERPIDPCRDRARNGPAEGKGQAGDEPPPEVADLPQAAEPGRTVLHAIVDVEQEGRARPELADAIL